MRQCQSGQMWRLFGRSIQFAHIKRRHVGQQLAQSAHRVGQNRFTFLCVCLDALRVFPSRQAGFARRSILVEIGHFPAECVRAIGAQMGELPDIVSLP